MGRILRKTEEGGGKKREGFPLGFFQTSFRREGSAAGLLSLTPSRRKKGKKKEVHPGLSYEGSKKGQRQKRARKGHQRVWGGEREK